MVYDEVASWWGYFLEAIYVDKKCPQRQGQGGVAKPTIGGGPCVGNAYPPFQLTCRLLSYLLLPRCCMPVYTIILPFILFLNVGISC